MPDAHVGNIHPAPLFLYPCILHHRSIGEKNAIGRLVLTVRKALDSILAVRIHSDIPVNCPRMQPMLLYAG